MHDNQLVWLDHVFVHGKTRIKRNWEKNHISEDTNLIFHYIRFLASATFSAARFSAVNNCWIPCVWLAIFTNISPVRFDHHEMFDWRAKISLVLPAADIDSIEICRHYGVSLVWLTKRHTNPHIWLDRIRTCITRVCMHYMCASMCAVVVRCAINHEQSLHAWWKQAVWHVQVISTVIILNQTTELWEKKQHFYPLVNSKQQAFVL